MSVDWKKGSNLDLQSHWASMLIWVMIMKTAELFILRDREALTHGNVSPFDLGLRPAGTLGACACVCVHSNGRPVVLHHKRGKGRPVHAANMHMKMWMLQKECSIGTEERSRCSRKTNRSRKENVSLRVIFLITPWGASVPMLIGKHAILCSWVLSFLREC